MDRGDVEQLVERIESEQAAIVLFDILNAQHIQLAGSILERLAQCHWPRFLVGSSGIVSALTELWKARGVAQPLAQPHGFAAVERLLVFSGSCSPITSRQIDCAQSHGFELIAIRTPDLASDQAAKREIARVVEMAIRSIDRGANVLIHSSRGCADERHRQTIAALQASGLDDYQVRVHSGQVLGPQFGRILRQILHERPVPRIGIAGGDTSGYLVRDLEIEALEAIAPFTPGVPLCRAHARGPLDGLELVLKGGQVGPDDIWNRLLTGTNNER